MPRGDLLVMLTGLVVWLVITTQLLPYPTLSIPTDKGNIISSFTSLELNEDLTGSYSLPNELDWFNAKSAELPLRGSQKNSIIRIAAPEVFAKADTVSALVLGYAKTTWLTRHGPKQVWDPYHRSSSAVNSMTIQLTQDDVIDGYLYGEVEPLGIWFPQFPVASPDKYLLKFIDSKSTIPIADHVYEGGFRQSYDYVLLFLLGAIAISMTCFGLLYLRNPQHKVFGVYGLYLFAQFIYWLIVVPTVGLEYMSTLSGYLAINIISQLCFHIAYIWFSIHLLDLDKTRPGLSKVLRMLNVALVAYILFVSLSFILQVDISLVANSFTIERLIVGVGTLFIALYVILFPENIYFKLLGFGTLCFVGGALLTMFEFGILPFASGVLIEIVCFSYALGLKIESDSQRRISTQQKAFELEREVLRTKDAALRAQMNPHFVSNVINALRALVLEEKNADAYLYMTKFAHLVRIMLGSTERALISVSEEVSLLRDYIVLEGLRFSTEIAFIVNIDQKIDARAAQIPPLILQPIVENAVHHGLVALKNRKPEISIFINLAKEGRALRVMIIDNGVGRIAARQTQAKRIRKRPSMALNIIKQRLLLVPAEIQISRDDLLVFEDLYDENGTAHGTKVVIHIPLERRLTRLSESSERLTPTLAVRQQET